jgi:GMP synthase-like glutamine amidotransferase
MIRLHYLQHVPFEGIGYIETYARQKNISISHTRVFDHEPFPAIDDYDWLVIMGGPMSVYEEHLYPWLLEEKKWIAQAIDRKKTVVGICLGAQLIASVLGAQVYPHSSKEIGWHPVSLTPGASAQAFGNIQDSFMAFHWHGDTFDIPSGAQHCARSEACSNQAFVYQQRVVGLQFHCESTPESIEALLDNCACDMTKGPFVQDCRAVRSMMRFIPEANGILAQLLDGLSVLP